MTEIGISIITVCFNSADTIEDTIKSVLLQNYANYEYLIIDGGSIDETLTKIRKYELDFKKKGVRFHCISEKDHGIYDAMNKGIKLATKEVVGIVNSDDWYELDILKKVSECYKDNNFPDIIHGNVRMYTTENKNLEVRKPNLDYGKLWRGMTLKHPTFFVKRDLYNSIGLFNTNYSISADYEFTLRAYINKARFFYCDYIISNMRLGGISNIHKNKSWKEVDEITKSYGLGYLKRRYYAVRRVITSSIHKSFNLKGGER